LILKEVRKRAFRRKKEGKQEEKQLQTRVDLHGDIAHFAPPSLQLFSFVLSLHHI
jgi:hypothetical protein